MTELEQRAILTLCLAAAAADGASELERAEIRRIADASPHPDVDLEAIYRDVQLRKQSLAEVLRELKSPEARRFAYEMAVCACDADGPANAAEREFLRTVRTELGLPEQAAEFQAQADALSSAPLADGRAAPAADEAELDRWILDAAILNGGLELLPETLATLAIIPLQMKLVYRIGRRYGYQLDRSYLQDFLATLGVGLTSQVLEQAARRVLGGIFGGLGRQAASSGMSFASTYALGQVARRYYAGGRKLDPAELRTLFSELLSSASALRERYAARIRTKTDELRGANLASLLGDR